MTFLTSYLAIWLTKEMSVDEDGALTNTAGDVVLRTAQATAEDTGGLETLFGYEPRDYKRIEMDIVFLDVDVAEHVAISRQVFSADQYGCGGAAGHACAGRAFATLAGNLRVGNVAEDGAAEAEFALTVDGRPARLVGAPAAANGERGAVTVVVEAGKRRRLRSFSSGWQQSGAVDWTSESGFSNWK